MLQLTYLNPHEALIKNEQPYSSQFNDVFFNDSGGLAETKHVFIEQNRLIKRWENATTTDSFCIAETGFGTGLNFLAVSQAWDQCQRRPNKLNYISLEKYPLNHSSMRQAHSHFPELKPYSEELLNVWGNHRLGIQTLNLGQGITLMLVLGDATESLSQLQGHVDAWFLDGFAPSKNPEMWQPSLFAEVKRLSNSGTTLATFTAASSVQKSLTAQGFKVNKQPGYGKKREMITATCEKTHQPDQDKHAWWPLTAAQRHHQKVTILGGGIAGMCLAHSFKQAGFETTVIDQHPEPMQMASGNSMAMMMPLLTAKDSPESLLYVRAFETALAFYQPDELHGIGVQQELRSTKQLSWRNGLAAANLPADLVKICEHHVFYPKAGYIDTRNVAQRLLADVDHWISQKTAKIKQSDDQKWQLLDEVDSPFHECDLLIVANGIQAQQLLHPVDSSLTAKHGQTTTVKPPAEASLDHILLDNGYVIPQANAELWLCGATFDHVPEEQVLRPAELHPDHWARNLKLWQGHDIYSTLKNATEPKGHAAIRATTPDHLPICGPLIEQHQFMDDYHDLHHGRHWQSYPPAQPTPNLYILNGLGSRGFTSAPLLAQYLTAMILAEPLPLEADLCKIIHPNRFLYRKLKKPPQQR